MNSQVSQGASPTTGSARQLQDCKLTPLLTREVPAGVLEKNLHAVDGIRKAMHSWGCVEDDQLVLAKHEMSAMMQATQARCPLF